jgi:hypothetical protein
MKRQRIGREVECFGNLAGRHAFGPGLHKQAEHVEAIVLGERGQGRDGICLFHISTIIESLTSRQGHFNNRRNNNVSMENAASA